MTVIETPDRLPLATLKAAADTVARLRAELADTGAVAQWPVPSPAGLAEMRRALYSLPYVPRFVRDAAAFRTMTDEETYAAFARYLTAPRHPGIEEDVARLRAEGFAGEWHHLATLAAVERTLSRHGVPVPEGVRAA